jgi:hypothetical protein
MPEIMGINRELIEATMHQAKIPGSSIAYAHGRPDISGEVPFSPDTTVIGVTEKQAIAAGALVHPDTVFGAASLSKPVFAYLVLKLIEKGVLSRPGEEPKDGLERKLHEILPLEDFFTGPGNQLSATDIDRAKNITPKMLLSHSSGISDNGSVDLNFNPGQEYEYSGVGLRYLQAVMEKVTGQSLQDLAQVHVFGETALKMPHSTYKFPSGSKPPHAANSLHTTASEYAKLMMAWMHDPSPIMQEAFVPQISLTQDKQKFPNEKEPAAKNVSLNDKRHLAWGLGLGLELDDKGSAVKAFHTGDMDQYRAQVALNLEQDEDKACIVYFSNANDDTEANGHVLGPLIISPKIPIPHAHTWFYEKFRFAQNVEELAGGPGFGLKGPKPEKKLSDSYEMMSALMPKQSPEALVATQHSQEPSKEADVLPSPQQAEEEEVAEERRSILPSPFEMTPKPPDGSH